MHLFSMHVSLCILFSVGLGQSYMFNDTDSPYIVNNTDRPNCETGKFVCLGELDNKDELVPYAEETSQVTASWPVNVTFINKPENTTVGGERFFVTFLCVSNPPALITYWYFNNRLITHANLTQGFRLPGRIRNETTLRITLYRNDHLGKYTCEVVTKEGVAQTSAWLTRANTPVCSLDFAVKPENMVLEAHNHGVLECKPMNTHHTVKWYKLDDDGTRKAVSRPDVLVASDDLLFISAKPTHQGTYICDIEDGAGCVSSAYVNLTVYRSISELCGTTPLGQSIHMNDILEDAVRNESVKKIHRGRYTAAAGTSPWMVSIQGNNYGHYCSGVVLNRYWVAAAAHCFASRRSPLIMYNTVLKFGVPDLRNLHQTRHFQKRIIHPKFHRLQIHNRRPTIIYDIVLLKLTKPLQFNDYVRPICLPYGENEISSKTQPGMTGLTARWGSPHHHLSDELQEMTLPIKTNTHPTCFGHGHSDFPMLFCAGSVYPGGDQPCRGDGGAPFATPVNKNDGSVKWYLTGLLSTGPSCREFGSVMVNTLTNITYVQDWIIATIRDQ